MFDTARRILAAALFATLPLMALATGSALAQDNVVTGSVAPVSPETRVYPAQPGAGAPLATDPGATVDPALPPVDPGRFSHRELVNAGHQFFGDVSQGLAGVVEHAISRYGLPNGYIIGEEASGAVIGGARYGEGVLYTKNAGQHRVYWQGPSLGLDVGANGNRVMMLIYDLPSLDALFRRYIGINGSAYAVAGLGMTVLSRDGTYVVPIVSGLGARLGVNFGYLKFTSRPTWNPF
ncbi:DUF1134 domain-containing protein [Bauldia sp.]|uniref:DUF1134 domain-containing protein n=1 Tax=Bauldia sp. TaxID=2575872 RepID=UPI003BAD6DA2